MREENVHWKHSQKRERKIEWKFVCVCVCGVAGRAKTAHAYRSSKCNNGASSLCVCVCVSVWVCVCECVSVCVWVFPAPRPSYSPPRVDAINGQPRPGLAYSGSHAFALMRNYRVLPYRVSFTEFLLGATFHRTPTVTDWLFFFWIWRATLVRNSSNQFSLPSLYRISLKVVTNVDDWIICGFEPGLTSFSGYYRVIPSLPSSALRRTRTKCSRALLIWFIFVFSVWTWTELDFVAVCRWRPIY